MTPSEERLSKREIGLAAVCVRNCLVLSTFPGLQRLDDGNTPRFTFSFPSQVTLPARSTVFNGFNNLLYTGTHSGFIK